VVQVPAQREAEQAEAQKEAAAAVKRAAAAAAAAERERDAQQREAAAAAERERDAQQRGAAAAAARRERAAHRAAAAEATKARDLAVWEDHERLLARFERNPPSVILYQAVPWPPENSSVLRKLVAMEGDGGGVFRKLRQRWHPDRWQSRCV
jgi:hypothetical protein